MFFALVGTLSLTCFCFTFTDEDLPFGVALEVSFADQLDEVAVLGRLVGEEPTLFEFCTSWDTRSIGTEEVSTLSVLVEVHSCHPTLRLASVSDTENIIGYKMIYTSTYLYIY